MWRARYDTSALPNVQLEQLLTRNAQLVVALRHAAAARHAHAPGHAKPIHWTLCNHADCKEVRALVELPTPGATGANSAGVGPQS